MKTQIETEKAPKPSGAYSQAIRANNTIYLAGQIPIDPNTGALISSQILEQVKQVFGNLNEVCKAAGGSLDDVVNLTIYLLNLADAPLVNDIMNQLFKKPYPARTTIEVSKLPKEALIEINAIMVL